MTKITLMKGFLAVGIAVLLGLIFVAISVLLGIGVYLSPQDNLKKADAIVAISGGETNARVEEAVQLYKDGWSKVLIFSGAAQDPNSPSNALAMKAIAVEMGVPGSSIIIEENAKNTKQNARNVNAILKARAYETVILVTSPYHQKRASITFERENPNIEIINHSAKDQAWRRSKWWATPKSVWLTAAELQKTIFLLLGGQPA